MPVEMVEKDGSEHKTSRLTDPELRQLALDILAGKVYTDRHIPQELLRDRLNTVFLPILFLDEASFVAMHNNPPGLLYEYLDKSAPRLLWNLPVFPTMKILSLEEAKIMFEFYNEHRAPATVE